MPSAELLQAAHAFLHAGLWEKLPAEALFRVDTEGGEAAFGCVMAGRDTPTTLLAYPGEAGLSSYLRLRTLAPDVPRYRVQEAMMQQDCLSCSFPEGSHHASFGRRMPYRPPAALDDAKDEALLLCVLQAANALAAAAYTYEENTMPCLAAMPDGTFQLSIQPFPDGSVLRIPSPEPTEEIIQAFRGVPTNPALQLLAELVIYPKAEGHPACYPVGLMLLNPDVGIVAFPVVQNFDQEYPALVGGLLAYILENGKPAGIRVRDDITYMLLMQTAEALALPLTVDRDLPEIDSLKTAFYDSEAL